MPATCRKKALGFERGHAAGASCGDCLTIDFVHNVATREHAQYAGSRRARYHLDVAVTLEGKFSCEQLRSRLVAYRHKPALRRVKAEFAGAGILEDQAKQACRDPTIDKTDDHLVPQHTDTGIAERPGLQT